MGQVTTKDLQQRRKDRARYKVKEKNKAQRKRIYLHISNRYMYAQLIDDLSGKTIVTVSSGSNKTSKTNAVKNKEAAKKLADDFTEKLKEKKIKDKEKFVFDRGQRLYHGRVKEFAERMREKGMQL
ncbi:MAG: 50S ribosomal protein L18 [Spirochaetia bacterium]|nr:50S ribosomal protein L18 [Spirochaetia bacterium]